MQGTQSTVLGGCADIEFSINWWQVVDNEYCPWTDRLLVCINFFVTYDASLYIILKAIQAMAPKMPTADIVQATSTTYLLMTFVFFCKTGASIGGPLPERDGLENNMVGICLSTNNRIGYAAFKRTHPENLLSMKKCHVIGFINVDSN